MAITLSRYVGRQIRLARKRKGWTQEQLADAIGYAPESISNIERGKTSPPIPLLEQVGSVLGVQVETFFEGSGSGITLSPRVFENEQRLKEYASDLSSQKLALAFKILDVLKKGD